jgi:hypothetical protein
VYCGLVVFVGVAAALLRMRRRLVPLMVFAAAGSLLSIWFIPLERLLLDIPGIRIVVFNRALPVVALCLCLIGAVGLSRLFSGRHDRAVVLAALGAATLSIAAAPAIAVAGLWVVLFAALAVARWRPDAGWVLVLVVVLVDLVPWGRSMLPVGRRDLFYPATAATSEMIGQTRRNGPWRVVATGTGYYPSTLAMHGLEDVRYHNPLVPQAYAEVLEGAFGFHDRREYFSDIRIKNQALLDFLNVRVVATRGGRGKVPGLKWLETPGDGIHLARNPDALRRLFIAPSAEVVPTDEVIASVAGLTDPRRVVVAAEDIGTWIPPERSWVPRAVRVEKLDRGRIELTLPAGGEKLLATSLTVPEGWRAMAEGRRLRTVTVNGAFLGVVVPAGVDAVHLRFVPPGLRLGLLFCAFSIATLVLGPFFWSRRNPGVPGA